MRITEYGYSTKKGNYYKLQVIVIVTCNYRYFTHCNWLNSGWYIIWRSVVFENCFYQQWQCVCMCYPHRKMMVIEKKNGTSFSSFWKMTKVHVAKWVNYRRRGDISFWKIYQQGQAFLYYYYYILLLQSNFFWRKKISSEKSWMIWNFFFLGISS